MDTSERKELEEELEHRACHDPLTGLPNRSLFMERLGDVLVRAAHLNSQLAVLFLDLDDFGTGYSSLSYLKRFPVDVLKIDRSFVEGLGHISEDMAIVRATVAFAKSLNLSVTAEGIETAEQLACVRELGCDLGQGFHFSKPLPSDTLSKVLSEGGFDVAGSTR